MGVFLSGCALLYLGATRGASHENKIKEFLQNKRTFSSLFMSQKSKVESEFTYLSGKYAENKLELCQKLNATLGLIANEIKPTVNQLTPVTDQLAYFNLDVEEKIFIDDFFKYVKNQRSEEGVVWELKFGLQLKGNEKCEKNLVTASDILFPRLKGRTIDDISNYLVSDSLIYREAENTLQSYRFIFKFDDSNTLFDYYLVSNESMNLAYAQRVNY
ncbi:hypothetical protein D1094_10440 [Colwellia sp. RSH04]|nr:hypothetical protein D1094_10440 [Colwellia sp. RSH04]